MSATFFIGLMLLGIGVLVIFAMYKNWDFIFNSNDPGDAEFNFLVRIFGRSAVRVGYAMIGAFLVFLGMLGVLGLVDLVKTQG